MARKVASPDDDDEAKLGKDFDSEMELLHVKWAAENSHDGHGEEKATTTTANMIMASWQNPVFKFEAEPCHVAQTNSRWEKRAVAKFRSYSS